MKQNFWFNMNRASDGIMMNVDVRVKNKMTGVLARNPII